jgi:hypothetical protein
MENFRTFLNNLIDFMLFGVKLYRKGTCDKPMRGDYHYTDSSETKGYTRQEAANVLGISVRQFDRRVQQGKYVKGHKYRNFTSLYWEKAYIDNLSKKR